MWSVVRMLCLAVPMALAGADPSPERIQSIQLGLEANTAGLQLLYSGSLRKTLAWRTPGEPWSALEGGTVVALTPAYGKVGCFGEWQPLPVRASISSRPQATSATQGSAMPRESATSAGCFERFHVIPPSSLKKQSPRLRSPS